MLARAAVGLGSLALTGCYGSADRREAVHTLRNALDMGVPLIDTADHYAAGAVERMIREAVSGGRGDGTLISTRGGLRFARDGALIGVDGSPGYLRRACEASLRRLGRGHIDVYYLAGVDPRVPLEESLGVLADLVAEGKIRSIGLSGVSAEQLRRAHAAFPVGALAVEYSLMERRAERELLPAARELGVQVVACRPLGRGLLTGRVASAEAFGSGDVRRGQDRFQADRLRRQAWRLRAAGEVATGMSAGLTRLALAWLLSRQDGVVPVPSTRHGLHLEMNVTSARLTVGSAESERLEACFPVGWDEQESADGRLGRCDQ
ncbi:aldo/keto reductase [Nonomuraea cavernae]|uniref:Oxidoreductase n=1 Tax=Nonomuraea cavernae TaxID=2045107 RepID=A0A917ZAQ3_9ACTN|nr:aldo/keto reductase [Nonomuraea cavernae]MCA2186673.1 aldo/keto reductase [Nonomuraea cavernae]GGO79803.1 oxidoreductase [Nonomuraea cavernae]